MIFVQITAKYESNIKYCLKYTCHQCGLHLSKFMLLPLYKLLKTGFEIIPNKINAYSRAHSHIYSNVSRL